MKKTTTFFNIFFALLFLLYGKAQAQTDGTMDPSFTSGDGFNTAVFSIAVQPDGKILAVGTFTSYKWTTQNRIIRLNTDGSIDASFDTGTGFDATANIIVLQPNGKILVGGQFTTYKGTSQNYITRLNTDGSIDTSFDIGTGFNALINTIALQTDGKILVGGNFSTYKGSTQNRIARLNTDGSIDTSFDIETGFNGAVNTIAVQTDGKIMVGGTFSNYKGVSQSRIVRLNTNGSRDTSFDIGTSFNNYVHRIALQPDGKIIATGQFSTYKGTSQNYIARIDTDGNLDNSFDTGTGFDALINAIALQSDGKILLGGNFTNYKGLAQSRVVRLNTNGSLDSSFGIGTGFNGNVQSIVLQNDRKILTGGSFTSYNSTGQFGISRLHNAFTIKSASNPTAGGTVTGDGTYNYGATATLTATATTGYTFSNWTEGGTEVSTNPEYSFTVTADRDLTANFTLNTHTISVSFNPTAGGTVTGAGTHNYGTTATLTATANTGYTFNNWTEGGLEVSTNPEYSFTVTTNRDLAANFTLNTHTISVSFNPTAGGTVTGTGTHNYGTTATLTVTANEGFIFSNWTEGGTEVSTNPEYSFTVTANRDLVANFTITTLPVTLVTFTAKTNGNHAKLQWQTNNEINNKGFIIYRSGDDKQFVKIIEVQAAHNTQLATYNYLDKQPLNGNNYYKLIQVDNDGKANELGVKTVIVNLQSSTLLLYPNPTENMAYLSFKPGNFTHLKVTDLNGKVMYNNVINATDGDKSISLGTYKTGIYMVTLSGNGKTETHKVLRK